MLHQLLHSLISLSLGTVFATGEIMTPRLIALIHNMFFAPQNETVQSFANDSYLICLIKELPMTRIKGKMRTVEHLGK